MSTPLAMFEHTQDISLPLGSASSYPGNLAVCYLDTRNTTFAAVTQNTNVHVAHWDTRSDVVTWESFNIVDMATEKSITITHVGLVHPNARSLPLLVVGTVMGTQVYDVRTHRLLMQVNLSAVLKVTPNQEKTILELIVEAFHAMTTPYLSDESCLGTHVGDILILMCNGETSISTRRNLKEHNDSIADIATCRFDEITCSATNAGEIIVWQKPVKGVQSRIDTKQSLSCINVLRKQVIAGTMRGVLLFYSVVSGDLMAEVHAHARLITSVSVAPESAYVMSASEDSTFKVYKLHTRKPHAYQVEYRYGKRQKDHCIVGAQFTNGRGSAIAISSYDRTTLAMYKIIKKVSATE
ncbi:unnamed protein product [Caenorhabditis auriculariae]|uniref:WD repeat-containing protein 54 beta-propeller domain-containing protein n=1 Tax=Caenorhabditis auriculariae TaxID=2777116 RepID=A0A8S1GQ31_9PELO|nr:unnamed protein product [Caenorhabditis auriculariae]